MESTRKDKNFVGFEYKDMTVSRAQEALYVDGYENFGWTLEGTASQYSPNAVSLKFKRDRKLRGNPELTRLQRQFDACAEDMRTLESSKGIQASALAYAIGIIGTAFMAGSVFAIIGGMIPLGIILAIPAFAGWVIPYPAYTMLRKKKTTQVTPMIDRKEDELYEICQKANALLAA